MPEIFSQEEIADQVVRESGNFTRNWDSGSGEKAQFDGWVSTLIVSAMNAHNQHQGKDRDRVIEIAKERFIGEAGHKVGSWAARTTADELLQTITNMAKKKTGQREVS